MYDLKNLYQSEPANKHCYTELHWFMFCLCACVLLRQGGPQHLPISPTTPTSSILVVVLIVAYYYDSPADVVHCSYGEVPFWVGYMHNAGHGEFVQL